jgi:hypothetical protein
MASLSRYSLTTGSITRMSTRLRHGLVDGLAILGWIVAFVLFVLFWALWFHIVKV